MRRPAVMALLAAVLVSLFVGVAPASGLSCIRPEEAVAHALKTPSETFFTGTATSIEAVSDYEFDVTFDVELFWQGPLHPESNVVERGQKPQKYPTFVVRYSATGTGGELVSGRRYHVVFENKSANPCSVWDVEEHGNLTDGMNPVDAYGDFTSQAGIDPSGPVEDDEAKAHWWAVSVWGALVLGTVTFAAFLIARRRRGHRHPGLGAIIGLDVGAALGWWLIVVPRLRDGDFYEVGDPLVVMGLPLLVVGAAVGATMGTFIRRGAADATSTRTWRYVAVVMASLVASMLATWWFLWGTGAVRFPS